jgi:hypothetical protein
MGLKRNLYYEIKDKVVEERQDGVHAYKHQVRIKEYGLNSTRDIRKLLIDILIERVEMHKDKIISPIIYNELLGMEIKRNGKVEHSASTHDDQVFSMLMALYVWYEGINLAERYGIRKTSIRTDEDVDEEINYYDDDTVEIVEHFNTQSELNSEIERDLNAAIKAGGIQMQDFIDGRRAEEKARFESLVNTPLGERAYRQKYNIPDNVPITNFVGDQTEFSVPDSIFIGFYNQSTNTLNDYYDSDQPFQNVGAVPEAYRGYIEGEDYSYYDHFNF